MKIINPVIITDSILVSTNVVEEPPTYWSSSTTYAEGDQVSVASNHIVYESLVDSNLNNDPTIDNEVNWVVVGATNPWRAFDSCIGTCKTTNLNSIYYELLPGSPVTGIAFFGLYGQSLNVTVTDPIEGEVYNETYDLNKTYSVYDWYTYFFSEFDFATSFTLVDLPEYQEATVEITITAASGDTAEVGEIVIGELLDLGITQRSLNFSIIDYSIKEQDIFGNFNVLKRAFSKRITADVAVYSSQTASVFNILTSIRTTPVVWIFTDNPDFSQAAIVYGYYRDFSTVLPHCEFSDMSLEVEGLT